MSALKKTLALALMAMWLTLPAWAANDTVRGIKKPKVCLESNIRCILRTHGNTKYWCLKSNIQRQLDMRHNASPISKTRGDSMGHCAQIITIDSTYSGD
ncbi:MAG: hypothetical protein RRB13_04095 [bacterium]|nr:hypothetical protein [bacterium]